MIKTKKLFVLVFLLLNCILFSACSQSKEVDFVKKYKIDLNTISDVTEVLQKAIDELPDDGVLFLQDGTYPLAGRIVFKENMTFKLSDNAILLNCSQDKNPMMAYNHPYKHNKAEGNSNIIIEGGIWDMNGQLDESGTPKNLPNAESINALGIGYGSNITIRNITFRDCYNGHVIQVAGSDNVLIENCRFEGQSFRGSGDKTRELLQIEPGTVKGYPYTLVQNKAPSTNVTIRNCYFGGSENTPHYMAAIGTHSQQAGVKCSDIVIEDCTFDNAAYTAIHFMAYDRITIRNNIFTITSDSEQIDRYGILADTYGSFIDPTGAESTTDFTIEGNTLGSLITKFPILMDLLGSNAPVFDYMANCALTNPSGLRLYKCFYPREEKTVYQFFLENQDIQKAAYTEQLYQSLRSEADFNTAQFMKIMIERIPRYYGFDEANSFMDSFKNHLEELSVEDIEIIMDTYRKNDQCVNRGKHSTDVAEINRYIEEHKKKECNQE